MLPAAGSGATEAGIRMQQRHYAGGSVRPAPVRPLPASGSNLANNEERGRCPEKQLSPPSDRSAG